MQALHLPNHRHSCAELQSQGQPANPLTAAAAVFTTCRPYICPATGTVAQSCNLKPVEQNYDCTEDCTSIGPQYFCGIFNCSGTCAPTCIADPWYEPPTYICGDTGVIAKECKVQNPTLTCKTMKCAPGHVCGPYDCTANLSDGGTNGGGSTRPGSTGGTGRRQLAGNAAILQEDSCRYRCVKDPYWTPPPVYRCQSNGEIATECGFLADKPLQRTGRSVSNRRQGVTNKPSRDMMWQPCDPECTEPGYFCMTATCGSDGTCGPTCVKDDNWVVSSWVVLLVCWCAVMVHRALSMRCAEF
jgi:hypothetical protein